MENKMTTKHTPGPWVIVTPTKKKGMALSGALFIGSENPLPGEGETVCGLGAGIVHFANAEANARLISAAPDIWASLRTLIGWAAWRGGWGAYDYVEPEAIAEARAVLVKVTGGEG